MGACPRHLALRGVPGVRSYAESSDWLVFIREREAKAVAVDDPGPAGGQAVVVLSVEEYRRHTASRNLLEVLRDSPFAQAVATGELDLTRPSDYGRDVSL